VNTLQIINEIKFLGEPDSEIFIRKYYFRQSTKYISKIMGIKENTIDKKVSRGLIKLKQTLGVVL
jgi:RNA polymerase sigma-70 factor (ECF subfamily)